MKGFNQEMKLKSTDRMVKGAYRHYFAPETLGAALSQ
jgi:hypothetical protein